MFLVNEVTLGSIFIAVGALFSSFHLNCNRDILQKWEQMFHLILLGWGILCWLAVCTRDIEFHFSHLHAKNYLLLFFSFSALIFAAMKRLPTWSKNCTIRC
jgi:hypothetical protein